MNRLKVAVFSNKKQESALSSMTDGKDNRTLNPDPSDRESLPLHLYKLPLKM